MLKTPQAMMNKINNLLSQYQQTTQVDEWAGTEITLSNGMVLRNKEKQRFVKRVTNTKTDLWIKNIDKLLHGEISECEIKSSLAALGGKAAQKKHGNIIKENLNTGTSWNAGTKGKNIGTRGPLPQSVKNKISLKNSGHGNGMYGVTMSEVDKKKRSAIMKKKILLGEFTPNSNNRNTHWESSFNGRKYRSSWEALYQHINPLAQYEILRVEYMFNNNTHIYIVDFVDHINKLVVEVKPTELCIGDKFLAKMIALTNWAKENKYSVVIADRAWFKRQNIVIDYSKFDNNTTRKIKSLYETN